MNQINTLDFQKDSTVGIINILQENAVIELIIPDSLSMNSGRIQGYVSQLKISSLAKSKYILKKARKINLDKLDCILFRKDPPIDNQYINELLILRELQYQDTLVLNSPESLLRFNEKLLGYQLSEPKVPTLISGCLKEIESFLKIQGVIVLKPLNLMAGKGIIKITSSKNSSKLISNHIDEYKIIIAQKYLKEIIKGDNRIIIYNGIVEENVLTRYPPKGDFIANLAQGGKYEIKKIQTKYLPVLERVASYLKYHGIFFAGIDMIGEYITEVNITSPTGIQQIKKGLPSKIAKELVREIKNYKTQ